MDEEAVDSSAPGWLNELEARREKKIKAKLGHEAGAGAPCTTCKEKCPGLDLHFWRKTCKNCKCKKENHDIQDQDVCSWAEFELLGSKPNKNKTLQLPDKDVKLDWMPKGDQEVVEKYMKDLPPELLPVKGSEAAKERKMLLQKQIPIHDIDPSLCHALTDEEVKKMTDYVNHVKFQSVGVGHLIQINFDKAAIKSDRVPAMVPNSQIVQLQSSGSCASLPRNREREMAKNLQNMSLNERNQSAIVDENISAETLGKIRDLHYKPGYNSKTHPNYTDSSTTKVADFNDNPPLGQRQVAEHQTELNKLPHYAGSTLAGSEQETVTPIRPEGGVRSVNYPAYEAKKTGKEPKIFRINMRMDLNYPSSQTGDEFQGEFLADNEQARGLPNYARSVLHGQGQARGQNPEEICPEYLENGIRNLSYPTYERNRDLGNYYGDLNKRPDGGILDNPLYGKNTDLDNYQGDSNKHSDGTLNNPAYKTNYGDSNKYSDVGTLNNPSYKTNPDLGNYFDDSNKYPEVGTLNNLRYNRNPDSANYYEDSNRHPDHGTLNYPNYQTNPNLDNYYDSNKYPDHGTMNNPNYKPNPDLDNYYDSNNYPDHGRMNNPNYKTNPDYEDFNKHPDHGTLNNPNYKTNPDLGNYYGDSNKYPDIGRLNKANLDRLNNPSAFTSVGSPDFRPTLPGNYPTNDRRPDSEKADLKGNYKPLSNVAPTSLHLEETRLDPTSVNVGTINDLDYYPGNANVRRAETRRNNDFDEQPTKSEESASNRADCHRCKKRFSDQDIVVSAERVNALYHTDCFKCAGCNQNLADLLYFYNKETDDIYCGRDYAKIRGIPRCFACDELIFVKEYCLAMDSTFHLKHFCCYECDLPLAGHNYVLEDQQPFCIPCYEALQADRCNTCKEIIKPGEPGVHFEKTHFHADDRCFSCKTCQKPMLGTTKFLFRDQNLFCSPPCYAAHQELRQP